MGFPLSAGWFAILLAWAWVLAFWMAADFCKVVVSSVFVKADLIKEHKKGELDPKLPFWVRALDWPGDLANAFVDMMEVGGGVRCAERESSLLCSTGNSALILALV